MQATNLKTNHLTQPLGIDAGTLFLSWQCAEGVRQTAYEIEVTAGAETLWASGKALGSVMHTETPSAVPPKTQGRWRIRLWMEHRFLRDRACTGRLAGRVGLPGDRRAGHRLR